MITQWYAIVLYTKQPQGVLILTGQHPDELHLNRLFSLHRKKGYQLVILGYCRPTRGTVSSRTDNIKMSMWLRATGRHASGVSESAASDNIYLMADLSALKKPLLMFIATAFSSDLQSITPLVPVKPERTSGGRSPRTDTNTVSFLYLVHRLLPPPPPFLQTNRL